MSSRLFLMTPLFLLANLLLQSAGAVEPVWTQRLDGPVAATPITQGDVIVVAAGQSLLGLQSDGSIEWQTELGATVLSTPAMSQGRIFVHTESGLVALDRNREVLWRYQAEDLGALVDGRTWGWGNFILDDPWAFYRSSPLATESAVVFGSSDGVHAVDRETGERLWHQFTGPVTTDIIGVEDGVVVADWSNTLRRLNLADGSAQWTFKARLPQGAYSGWIGWTGLNLNPLIADGRIFLGSRGSYFYAISLETGTEIWSNKHGTSWIGSAGVAHDGNVYFGLSDGKALIGIDRASGNQSLFVPTPGPVFATPVVFGQHLVAGTIMGELLIVNLSEGRLVQTHRLHDDPRPYSDYFQPDPDSDLGAYEYTVRQMELMKQEQQSVLSLAIFDGLLVVGTGSGDVLGFDIEALALHGDP